MSPGEAAIVAATTDNENLVVAKQRRMSREQVARRWISECPDAKRHIFFRCRYAREEGEYRNEDRDTGSCHRFELDTPPGGIAVEGGQKGPI